MDFETSNMMNADLYRVVLMMLIDCFKLIVGPGSLMFVLAAVVLAVSDFLGETRDTPPYQTRARSRRLA